MDVFVVGSCNIDLLSYCETLPRPGETLTGNKFVLGNGGKGANQAVMAARLGAKVRFLSKVGKDMFGEYYLKNLEKEGIDISSVGTTDQASTGVAAINVDSQGRNSIVITPGANNLVSKDEVQQIKDIIKSSKVLLSQLEISLDATIEALKIAKSGDGGPITIHNPAPASILPAEIFPLCDFLCPNETEAEALSGVAVDSIENAEKAGKLLLEKGAKNVLITLGEKGCLLVTPTGVSHIPAEKVKAVDTTGAGDCFLGSFAFFLAKGKDTVEAIKLANKIAAISVQHHGTQTSFPTRAQLPPEFF